jgi:hypothetical protein
MREWIETGCVNIGISSSHSLSPTELIAPSYPKLSHIFFR